MKPTIAILSLTFILVASQLSSSLAAPTSDNQQAEQSSDSLVPNTVEAVQSPTSHQVDVPPTATAEQASDAPVEPAVIISASQHVPSQPVVSHYSPANVVPIVDHSTVGVVRPEVVLPVIASSPPVSAVPVPVAHSVPAAPKPVLQGQEQFGQPEYAAIPPNYKPWGSWGLYIGGSPSDGYYTNFYKSLSSSVEKATASDSSENSINAAVSKPQSSVVVAQLKPIHRQFTSSPAQSVPPFAGANFYPLAYSTGDFAANSPVYMSPQPQPQQLNHNLFQSPQLSYPYSLNHFQPSMYSSGDSFVQPASYVPELYAVKGGSQQHAVKGASGTKTSVSNQKNQETDSSTKSGNPKSPATKTQPLQPSYYYATPVSGAIQPVISVQPSVLGAVQQQTPQITAYPVPVGSQIVGSQVGVDGAFYPYGIHAFTKYALKPTAVGPTGSDSNSPVVVENPASVAPVYSQSQLSVPVSYRTYSAIQNSLQQTVQPQHFYAYPASQLHYSNGAVAIPSGFMGAPIHHHQDVGGYSVAQNNYKQQASPVVSSSHIQPSHVASTELKLDDSSLAVKS